MVLEPVFGYKHLDLLFVTGQLDEGLFSVLHCSTHQDEDLFGAAALEQVGGSGVGEADMGEVV